MEETRIQEEEELQFKINGDTHHVITPISIAQLKQAEEIRDELETLEGQSSGSKESLKYRSLHQEQEKRIREYLERFDTFDNRILNNNINYLAKMYGVKIGALESYIGLSTGYISRTAKDGAARKLSIESVWKIAKFFDVDLNNLVGTDLGEVKGNTFLLMRFLNKVIRLTKSGKVQWYSCGGVSEPISEWFVDKGIIKANEEGKPIYHSEIMDDGEWCYLKNDIMVAEDFSEKGISLNIIPYGYKDGDCIHYDYYMSYDDFLIAASKGKSWQKVMFTYEDPYGHLNRLSEELYALILDYESDAKVDTDMHDFLELFVD